MNKVITINLDGIAYQLEEGGYEALRVYLEAAATRLAGNPDKDEILSDIERALGDKFRALLGSHKTVVEEKEVAAAITEMGPIEADAGDAPGAGASADAGATDPKASKDDAKSSNPFAKGNNPFFGAGFGSAPGATGPGPRRLYKLKDGAMFAGVCNGIAAYLSIDPTFIRLAFVALVLLGGSGVLIYIILMFILPEAHTAEEKAAASGVPPTAQEFIRRAKEGYYEAMKGFPDRQARREWKRRFKHEMRANSYQWRQQWQKHWPGCGAQTSAVPPRMGFTLPFLSVFHGVANVLWVCVLVSLLATGTVLGRALPSDVPVWVAVLVLFLVYGVLVEPLKATRYACYRGPGRSGWGWSLVFVLDALVWMAVVAVLLLLAVHFFPQLREAVDGIPTVAHQAVSDIKTWWKSN